MRNLLFICFVLITFCSCRKDAAYSCDEKVNAYVIENKASIEQMSIREIVGGPKSYQIAMFKISTPEKQLELWNEKFNGLLKLDWSEAELNHISKFREFLTLELFSEKGKIEKVRPQIQEWIAFGKEKFGWSKQTIGAILNNLENPIDKQGNFAKKDNKAFLRNLAAADETGTPTCDCNKTSDYCSGLGGGGFMHCGTYNCTQSSGCGILWLESCNGYCVV